MTAAFLDTRNATCALPVCTKTSGAQRTGSLAAAEALPSCSGQWHGWPARLAELWGKDDPSMRHILGIFKGLLRRSWSTHRRWGHRVRYVRPLALAAMPEQPLLVGSGMYSVAPVSVRMSSAAWLVTA